MRTVQASRPSQPLGIRGGLAPRPNLRNARVTVRAVPAGGECGLHTRDQHHHARSSMQCAGAAGARIRRCDCLSHRPTSPWAMHRRSQGTTPQGRSSSPSCRSRPSLRPSRMHSRRTCSTSSRCDARRALVWTDGARGGGDNSCRWRRGTYCCCAHPGDALLEPARDHAQRAAPFLRVCARCTHNASAHGRALTACVERRPSPRPAGARRSPLSHHPRRPRPNQTVRHTAVQPLPHAARRARAVLHRGAADAAAVPGGRVRRAAAAGARGRHPLVGLDGRRRHRRQGGRLCEWQGAGLEVSGLWGEGAGGGRARRGGDARATRRRHYLLGGAAESPRA